MREPDFLGLEGHIARRLHETVCQQHPARVIALADVKMAYDPALPVPSLRLAYVGHTVVSDRASATMPGAWHVEQTWLVVIAVRNSEDILGGTPARLEISPLCNATLDALANWRPCHEYGPLRHATPPAGPAGIENRVFIPFAFMARLERTQHCDA